MVTVIHINNVMHKGKMKNLSFLIPAIFLLFVQPVYGMELSKIKSSDQLARFIYNMAKNNITPNKLLKGIESKETLNISGYEVEIPVREVFGTIVIERFGDKIDQQIFENNKTYNVRAICAFIDHHNIVWRYSITILEEKQYNLIKKFLEKRIKYGHQK